MIILVNDTNVAGKLYIHSELGELSMDELAILYMYYLVVQNNQIGADRCVDELCDRQKELHESWEKIDELSSVEDRYGEGYEKGMEDACTDYERGFDDGKEVGFTEGEDSGYEEGYKDGIDERN